MKVISLYSGSSGNCTYIDLGKRKILVDAGGSAKALIRALKQAGADISEISDIFITHEHSDHIHALYVLLKNNRISLHLTNSTAKAMSVKDDKVLFPNAVLHENEYKLELFDGCSIEAFSVPHDSAFCVGYKITDGKTSVGIATDLGYVTQRVYDVLSGCDAVMIESNHDTEMVRNGIYPQSLKHRILSGGGHLSNTDCAEISGALARRGTRSILLTHLSRDNNTPECAYSTVDKAVSKYGVKLSVASRDALTELALV